jgi:hypothetical protein
MLLEKLDRYIDYIEWTESEDEIPIDEVMKKYVNSSSDERIKMLFEMNEQTRERIKALIDGGII